MATKLSFQEKILKHRLTIIYRVVLGIVLIAAIIIIVRMQIQNHVYSEYEVIKATEPIGSDVSSFEAYNGNILCYSRDGISAYSTKGTQIWNVTYEMQFPIVVSAGEYVAVCDYKGSVIRIMDGSGPCGELDTNKIIIDLKISEKGVVTATLDDGATTWLNLYSSSGEEIVSVKTSMNQSGYPVQTSLSSDNQKFAVSYLKAQGSGLNTSIAFYNFGDVGQNATDKIVSGFNYENTAIPYLKYVDANNVVAVGEKQLLIYSGSEIPDLKAQADVEDNIKSVFTGSGMICLVYNGDKENEKYRFDLYDMNAKKIMSQGFDIEYSNIVLGDNYILIYDESHVVIFNKKGIEKYHGDLGGGIRGLISTGNGSKFVVVKNEALETIRLK